MPRYNFTFCNFFDGGVAVALGGTLSGVEMGLELAGVPHKKGGVAVALEYLTEAAKNANAESAMAR